jgi:arylsulfatase A-like enzyme
LLDREGVVHMGRLVAGDGSFEWDLPEGATGQLRLAWSSPKKAGIVSLVVEEIFDGAAPRETARVKREFPAASAPAAVWDESLRVRARGAHPRLRLHAEPPAPLFLSDLRLVRPSDTAPAVVVFLFDTTRRDAVGFGGSSDPSTPNFDAILRDAWKADRAYAAASWTIPSVASILTGRVPAAHEDADGSPLGIVSRAVTLAEDFRQAGWSTAAFLANPTLREENGFAAGFQTFFVTPYDGASIVLPGRETAKHVPSWLATHRGEPFLLLINLLDPHDPYQPFDRPLGKTPFDPNYTGPIVGDEVNRLQLGEMATPPPAGVRHLTALYHDEVRLADAEVGKLWNSTPAQERERWTVVFTADHGEELGEHRGWKHGPALYDEVLRVPLAIRAGVRRGASLAPKDSLVSLLDLLPTLEALSGLPRPRRPLDGRNLLDAGAGQREVLPAVTMLTGGAPRAAVVRRERKLFFFDRLGTRGIPDPVKDPSGHRLALRLREILPGLGTFDLARDPGEKSLLPIDRASFPDDWRSIEQAIAHTRRGIELRASGPGAAGPLEIDVEGFGPAASVEPFALEEDDRFSWKRESGRPKLSAHLDLSDGIDGLKFDDAAAENLRITVGGTAAPCAVLILEAARPVPLEAGRPRSVPVAAIPESIPRFEAPGGCAGVFLWKAAGKPPSRTSEEEDEAWKKLRALGYLH